MHTPLPSVPNSAIPSMFGVRCSMFDVPPFRRSGLRARNAPPHWMLNVECSALNVPPVPSFRISGLKARHVKARAKGPGKRQTKSLSPVRAKQFSINPSRWIAPATSAHRENATKFPPLPKGEGRGEGEGAVINPCVRRKNHHGPDYSPFPNSVLIPLNSWFLFLA